MDMATQIEVLSGDANQLQVALYYTVPAAQQVPNAADTNREPSGARLSIGEVTALKAGTLFEYRTGVPVNGMTQAQIATRLQALWTELTTDALASYKGKFIYAGKAYDSVGGWS